MLPESEVSSYVLLCPRENWTILRTDVSRRKVEIFNAEFYKFLSNISHLYVEESMFIPDREEQAEK